ncbi:MAG: hypothetical protein QOE90_2182 [Thermoplasmata archaeon]|jgi:hypothetical protein|nr:hypothetical protein [Thermoplasmata archaeon]
MRSLLLALALAASVVALLPGASASPCPESPGSACPPGCGVGAMPCYAIPVGACVRATQPTCPGLVCVNHPTLAFIDNPTCVNVVAESFQVCTEQDFATCGPNLICVIGNARSICVPDPCYTTECF